MLERKTVSQCPTSDYCKGWNDAVDAMPKWISVKENLPENDDHYLVFASDRNAAEVATYYGDGEWLTLDLTNLTPLVTHWMSLPELPVEVV